MPVLVAPMAFQRLAHADGELATARAARTAGTVMCLSSLSTTPMEEVVAAAAPSPVWFQLYVFRDHDVTDIMARMQARLVDVHGITVYLQPVQDLTVDARIARTQYQYTIEDPDPAALAAWGPRMLEAM